MHVAVFCNNVFETDVLLILKSKETNEKKSMSYWYFFLLQKQSLEVYAPMYVDKAIG